MYGDSGKVRSLARAMRVQAEEIRAESAALLAAADAVSWTGLAADTLHHLGREHAAALAASAGAHDEAAEALERHAREIDHTKALIAAVERRVNGVLDSLGGLSGSVRTRVGHWLSDVHLPPPGHPAWLDLRLPRWLP